MEYPATLGRLDIPEEVRSCFGTELHEYIVAVGAGGSGDGNVFNIEFEGQLLFHLSQSCLAALDITSGEIHSDITEFTWFLSYKEWHPEQNPFPDYDTVYRVKGYPLRRDAARRNIGDVMLREVTAIRQAHPYLQGLIAKQYPIPLGDAEIDSDVMAQYEPELHEYLIAATYDGSVSAWGWQGFHCDHSIRAQSMGSRGIIDLTTGAQSDALTCVTWYSRSSDSPRMQEKKRIPFSFATDKIYRIKGYPPKKRAPSDRLRFTDGVFLREVLEYDVQNAFLQKLIDDFNTKVTIQSEILGELELNKSANWYSRLISMCGGKHLLIVDASEQGLADRLNTAETIIGDFDKWDAFFRRSAAEHLLADANEMLNDFLENEEQEPHTLTAAELEQNLEYEHLEITADGSCRVLYFASKALFGDDRPFIVLTGTLADGVQEAEIDYS